MKKKRNEPLRVPYAAAVYGKEEKRAVAKVLENPLQLAAGYRVKAFEKAVAKLFGKKHGIMVNSGSSANLTAVEALDLPRGSEVITPALTFSTTVAPLLQKGLKPVFADVEEGKYTFNIDELESLITKKTKALMVPLLIGSIPDMARLQRIARKHDLKIIEDSCDTLGGRFAGKPSGTYSDITTTSFYASHIITAAGSGGMVCINDPKLARRALVISNWGRESTLFGVYEESEAIKKRFAGTLDGEPYDAKFIFSEVGYNFQSTELNAAFGLEQLGRFPSFKKRRQSNFKTLQSYFKKYEHFFVLPETHPKADTAWLAFPLEIRQGAPFTRYELTRYLEEQNVQTRPVFTGNIFKQPGFARTLRRAGARGGPFPVADRIMKKGFLIGCHHGLTSAHIARMKEVFDAFLSKY